MRTCLSRPVFRSPLIAAGVFLATVLPLWGQQAPQPAQITESIRALGSVVPAERKEAQEFLKKHAVRAWEELNAAAQSEDPEVRAAAEEIIKGMSGADRQNAVRRVEVQARQLRAEQEQQTRDELKKAEFESVGKLVAQGIEGWRELDQLVQEAPTGGDSLVAALRAHHYPQYLIAARTEETDAMLERFLLRAVRRPGWGSTADYATYHALRGTLDEAIKQQEGKLKEDDSPQQKELVQELHEWVKAHEALPSALPTAADLGLAKRPLVVPPRERNLIDHPLDGLQELDCRIREGNEEQVYFIFRHLAAKAAAEDSDYGQERAMKICALGGLPDYLVTLAGLRDRDSERWAVEVAKARGLLAQAHQLEQSTLRIGAGKGALLPAAYLALQARKRAVTQGLATRYRQGEDIWADLQNALENKEWDFSAWGLGTDVFGFRALRWLGYIQGAHPGLPPLELLKQSLAFDPERASAGTWRELLAAWAKSKDELPFWYVVVNESPFLGDPPWGEFDRLGNMLEHDGVLGTVAPICEELGRNGSGAAWYLAGETRRKTGGFAEGERAFQEVLAVRPTCLAARVYLSYCLAQQGKNDEAKREMDTARLMPLDAWNWRHWVLLHCLEDAGDRAGAERECELACRYGMDFTMQDAHVHHLARDGKYEQAAALALRVFYGAQDDRFFPHFAGRILQRAATLRRWEGRAALAAGQEAEAVRLLDMAGRICAEEPFEITEDLALLAEAGATEGRAKILAYHLDRLRTNLAVFPNDPQCHAYLGWVLAVTGEDPEQAVDLARQALALDPSTEEEQCAIDGIADYWLGGKPKYVPEAVWTRACSYDVLAEALAALGQTSAAVAAAEQALRWTDPPDLPDYWVDHYHMPTLWEKRQARLERLRTTLTK